MRSIGFTTAAGVIGAVILAAAPAAASPLGGVYETDWGQMTVLEWGPTDGSGKFEHKNGRFEGKRSGNTLRGYWFQDDAAQACAKEAKGTKYWGRAEFVFSADGKSFTGKWSYCERLPNEVWNGKLIRRTAVSTAPPAPAPTSPPTSAGGGSAGPKAIILFGEEGLSGRSVRLTGDVRNLESVDFNDTARSVSANGRWRLCLDADYSGQCIDIEGDDPRLDLSVAGSVSSVRYLGPGRQGSAGAATTSGGPAPQAGGGRADGISAKGFVYDSGEWGELTVSTWEPAAVAGSFTFGEGRFKGERKGDTVTGRWYQSASMEKCANKLEGTYYHGRMVYRFNADRTAFTGVWGYCNEEPTRAWDGTLLRRGGGGQAARSPDGAVGRVGQAAKDEAERRVTDKVREGVGSLFER